MYVYITAKETRQPAKTKYAHIYLIMKIYMFETHNTQAALPPELFPRGKAVGARI
jgi:hypothetical protein